MVLLVISLTVFLASYFITKSLAVIIICSLMGYLLSLDLAAAASHLYHFLVFRNKVTSGKTSMDVTSQTSTFGFLWKFGLLQCLYHLVMMVAVGIVAGLVNSNTGTNGSIGTDVWKILGYSIIGCCCVEKILRDIQNVYVLFGLWRNFPCIYPMSVIRSFTQKRARLRAAGFIRRLVVNWGKTCYMYMYVLIGW